LRARTEAPSGPSPSSSLALKPLLPLASLEE
jgi:hypothetical protein